MSWERDQRESEQGERETETERERERDRQREAERGSMERYTNVFYKKKMFLLFD